MSEFNFPDWFTAAKTGEKAVVVKDKSYTIHILSRELAPLLTGFVGQEQTTGEFFASEDVPDEFLPYVMAHEVVEYTDLKGQHGRCMQAMAIELNLAIVLEDDRYKAYLNYRLDFFRRLVEYYQDKTRVDDLKFEIGESLAYLERYIAEMG